MPPSVTSLSPLYTLDVPGWPQLGCPGPLCSLGTQCYRHGPCCRRHPGDAAGHSMLHRAHRSGKVSGGRQNHYWGWSPKDLHPAPNLPMPPKPHPHPCTSTLLAWNSSRLMKRSMDLTCWGKGRSGGALGPRPLPRSMSQPLPTLFYIHSPCPSHIESPTGKNKRYLGGIKRTTLGALAHPDLFQDPAEAFPPLQAFPFSPGKKPCPSSYYFYNIISSCPVCENPTSPTGSFCEQALLSSRKCAQ